MAKTDSNNPFNCSQTEFLRIALKIWGTVRAEQKTFADFKALYTDAYIGARIKEIEDAQKLPELPAITEAGKVLRDKLATQAEDGILDWLRLERYIHTAFPNPADLEAKLKSAGKDHLTAARKLNWDNASSLLTAGNNFLKSQDAALKANQNMPDAFPGKYEAAFSLFSATLTEYTKEKENRAMETGKRGKTMLMLWELLQNACNDGRIIYVRDPEKKKLVTFSEVRDLVLGTQPGGIKGRVEDAKGKPLSGVKISIAGREEVFFTDKNGRYEMLQLGAGAYLLSFSFEGFLPFELEVLVRAGVRTRAKVVVLGRAA